MASYGTTVTAMFDSDLNSLMLLPAPTNHPDDSVDGVVTIGVRGIGGGASGWQNLINPYDVDGNGRVTPLDALILVNEINRSGPRKLAPPTAAEPGSPMFLDTNGDGHLTAMDVLMVINYLNQGLLAGSESARAERPAG